MSGSEAKDELQRYTQRGREGLLWKVDGLSEYDVRRPLTRTGTNLLGLVKHLAAMESLYFGVVFDRPFPESQRWLEDDVEPNADLWATVEESRESILGYYRRACAHADATIDALPLDAVGRIPWWGENARQPLRLVLVHMLAETNRHAGQADIVRELVDGAVGMQEPGDNLPELDDAWWDAYRQRLEDVARHAAPG